MGKAACGMRWNPAAPENPLLAARITYGRSGSAATIFPPSD